MYLDKIKSREELRTIIHAAKEQGQTVVQCHGCFDILHPGHLRHLAWARRQGHLLVVSVSADSVVQKGRNRPFVPERLRAESLAVLELVDFVTIDDGQWAGPILELLQPDIYVKGKEFEGVFDGRFGRERRLVERYGGRVLFSSGDVVYSSSKLIDQHRDQLEPVREQVHAFCQRHNIHRARLNELSASIEGRRVLVIGETIVDTYVYAEPLGMSAEAPVLVVRPRERETFIGGAAIVAQHLGGLGAAGKLASVVGQDEAGARVRATLEEMGVTAQLLEDATRPTIVKTRYIADSKKLLNVNEFSDHNLDTRAESALIARLDEWGDDLDAIVVTDFGYGVVTAGVLDWVARCQERRGLPVVGDVQCSTQLGNVRRMKGLTLLAPSEREARLSLCDRDSGVADLGARILLDSGSRAVVVTLGSRGLMLLDAGESSLEELRRLHLHEVKQSITIEYLPSLAPAVVDPMGAGDAMLAAIAACLAAGGSVVEATFMGMAASAIAVGNMGNVPVSREQVASLLGEHTPSD